MNFSLTCKCEWRMTLATKQKCAHYRNITKLWPNDAGMMLELCPNDAGQIP